MSRFRHATRAPSRSSMMPTSFVVGGASHRATRRASRGGGSRGELHCYPLGRRAIAHASPTRGNGAVPLCVAGGVSTTSARRVSAPERDRRRDGLRHQSGIDKLACQISSSVEWRNRKRHGPRLLHGTAFAAVVGLARSLRAHPGPLATTLEAATLRNVRALAGRVHLPTCSGRLCGSASAAPARAMLSSL
jgi:hypothetical protein